MLWDDIEPGMSSILGDIYNRGVQTLANLEIFANLYLKFANLIWNCDYKCAN